MPLQIRTLFILVVGLCLGVALGCQTQRVDPGYMALVEMQERDETPTAGALGPTDKFSVRVFEEENLSGEFTVAPDGTVNYPHIGRITVEGKTCADIERRLSQGLEDGYLQKATVSCTIVEYNSKRIFIFGEVKSPGSFPYKTNITIIDAFALAGGFTERANSNNTRLTRVINGNEVQVRIPMQEIVEGRRKNLKLLPGDIVYVPESAY
ncbi:MAG: polysaccharide biosynthesis/export family protein [Myxococcota bacterium]